MTQAKMSDNVKWTFGIMAVVMVALVIGLVIEPSVDLDAYIAKTDAQANENVAIEQAKSDVVAEKDAEIVALQTELDSLSEPEVAGFLVDELFLNIPFPGDTYSDRELINLFDGEVRFDGEDYDVEETLVIEGLEFVANGNDFEGAVYMSVPSGAIAYILTFDSELNTSLISEDETLEFSLLGDTYEVSSWDNTEVTLTKGEEFLLDIGTSVTIGEQVITLESVSDDRVYITVDGVGKTMDEGSIKVVEGLEIKARDIFNSDTRSFAVFMIAEELESTLEDEDEYEEDSAWEWAIDANSIGLVLSEDHTQVDADGDEDFPAVASGESLCLPNDYVCVLSNGLSEEDQEEVSFELDVRSGQGYVRVEGRFLSGLEDYSRLYVNASGIYNRDLELVNNVSVELGDTDLVLNISTSWITVGDFRVNYLLNNSESNGAILDSEDEDYLSEYGISIVNPEDSAEDNQYSISVPKEQLEGSFSLLM